VRAWFRYKYNQKHIIILLATIVALNTKLLADVNA